MTSSPTDGGVSHPNPPESVACANCGKPYRYDQNILTGEWLWFKPRKSKGCTHEVILIDGELHVAEQSS